MKKFLALKRLARFAMVAGCASLVVAAETARAALITTASSDFESVVIPSGNSVNLVAGATPNTIFTTLSGTSGGNGVNSALNVSRVEYDISNIFGKGTTNKVLYAKDGAGSTGEGGNGTTGTPWFTAPATISGGAFQVNFEFHEPILTRIDNGNPVTGGGNGHRIALSTSNGINGPDQSMALRFSNGRLWVLEGTGGLTTPNWAAVNYAQVANGSPVSHSVVVVGNFGPTSITYGVNDSHEIPSQHYHVWLNGVRLWADNIFDGNIPFRYNGTTSPVANITSSDRLVISGSAANNVSNLYLDNLQVWNEIVFVPEPHALVLLGLGVTGIVSLTWSRQRRRVN